MNTSTKDRLCVEINSFSYMRGIPLDKSDRQGGFVFDCRVVNNPGRQQEYKDLTGRDHKVIEFFKKDGENMGAFLQPIKDLLSISINRYIQCNLTNLQINFGCTGGRHRSVYAAEQVASYLKDKYDVKIILRHIEREIEEGIKT